MLNIVDLEKRWMIYKIKSYIPHFSIFISLIVIVSIFLSFSSNPQGIEESQKAIFPLIKKGQKDKELLPLSVQAPVMNVEPIKVVKLKPQVMPTSKKVMLAPSLEFMRKMQNSMQPYYKNETIKKKHVTEQVEAPKVEIVEQQVVIQEYKTLVPVKVKKISIKRQNTQNDIYEIITRFKKNNNPALSLFVAKKYYELQDYQQAYNYALITNKINKEIESSWIIFTKSLVKLGKREKSISTLKKYIKQSHSSTARILLDEIYAGRFK
ncbi:MAG: hypothetical protein COA30_02800 [Sulfurimonas sp.]|nr:MAG: hypothetical protein COA30_02800 [Sulfurimonas sp.]